MNKDFETWFTDNMTPYTFRSEWFYGDVEIDDKELRKDMMYKWLLAAYEEGCKIDGKVEHYICADSYTEYKKTVITYDVKSKR